MWPGKHRRLSTYAFVYVLCTNWHICVKHRCVCHAFFLRLRGRGAVGQWEAEAEGVYQEDSVPGQPAAQPSEDL